MTKQQDNGSNSPAQWIQCLMTNELFSELEKNELEVIANELVFEELSAGSVLIKQGDLSQQLFILYSGQLKVIFPKTGRDEILQPGACIDENALLIGERRLNTVTAVDDCCLLKLNREHFQALQQKNPNINAHFSKIIMQRLQRRELQETLFVSNLFKDMGQDALNDLEQELELVACDSGEALITEGETSQCGYIIISGRLSVSYRHPDKGEQILSELSRGQTVGEIAVITNGKRTATVRAIRDSLLAKLSKPAFDRLLQKHPQDMMKHFAGKIITQLQKQSVGKHKIQHNTLNIAVVATDPSTSTTEFTERLVNSLAKLGATLHLNANLLDNHLSPAGIASTPLDDPNSINIARWLNRQESQYRFIIYQADSDPSEWSKRCIHQADRILLVGNATGSCQRGGIEKSLLEDPVYQHLYKNLVLLHEAKPDGFQRTQEWLENRNIRHHYHLNMSDNSDIDRVARLLTGNGVGLVVSGGGARGFAHIGGIKALHEAGIPVDKVGGTSMGSIVAAMLALDWDYPHMLKQATSFNYKLDYTFPAVSLTSGANFTNGLQQNFGDQKIEDLHLGFFCVSTDLSSASQKLHNEGSLWKYIRASASIPGLFPPVIDDGDFLVDGALVNNMPVDVMAHNDDIGYVIAFDVSSAIELETDIDINGSLSGWTVIGSWLNPFKRAQSLPKLSKTLIQSSSTKSDEATELTKRLADFYLQFPVQQYGLIEFKKIDQIVKSGYQHAKSRMAELKQSYDQHKET